MEYRATKSAAEHTEDIEALVGRWRGRLGLGEGWDIDVAVVADSEAEFYGSTSSFDYHPDADGINRVMMYVNVLGDTHEIRKTIVHELVHLVLVDWDCCMSEVAEVVGREAMRSVKWADHLERAVDRITDILLSIDEWEDADMEKFKQDPVARLGLAVGLGAK